MNFQWNRFDSNHTQVLSADRSGHDYNINRNPKWMMSTTKAQFESVSSQLFYDKLIIQRCQLFIGFNDFFFQLIFEQKQFSV